MGYITVETVTASLNNADWAISGDDSNLAVMLSNAWLSSKSLPNFEIVPADILMAGALIAQAYANGEMFQGKTEATVIEKSVKADSVEVSKKFAEGEIVMGKNETIALQLIAPYLVKTKIRQVRVGRA